MAVLYGGYWQVWLILPGMAANGWCGGYTGRYDQYWLDGVYCHVWLILAGIADTGRYGRYWHLWRILAGMAVTG